VRALAEAPAPQVSTWAAWLVALALLATGTGKALDVPGFALVLAEYRLLPVGSEPFVALAVTLAELGLAMALLHPATRVMAAWGAVLLFMANAAVLSLTLLRGVPLANCGCFGVFLARPLRVWTPLEDIVLAALAILATRRVR
jgi:hypothetical protein